MFTSDHRRAVGPQGSVCVSPSHLFLVCCENKQVVRAAQRTDIHSIFVLCAFPRRRKRSISVFTRPSAYRLSDVDEVRAVESVIESRLMPCLPRAKNELSTILCRKRLEAVNRREGTKLAGRLLAAKLYCLNLRRSWQPQSHLCERHKSDGDLSLTQRRWSRDNKRAGERRRIKSFRLREYSLFVGWRCRG